MNRCDLITICAFVCFSITGCGDSNSTESDSSKVPPVSVRTVEVVSGPIQTWVFAEGTARATTREFLSFESAGRIAYVAPNLKEGDPVSQDQVIAYQQQARPESEIANARRGVVDAKTQHAIAEAVVAESSASLQVAESTFRRFENLVKKNSASQQELDDARSKLEQARTAKIRSERELDAAVSQIKAAKAQAELADIVFEESRIVSPIEGVLARLNIEQGYYFSPQQIQSNSEAGALSTVPVVIIDSSEFEITIKLPSYTFRQISVGSEVLFKPSLSPDRASKSGSQSRRAPSQAPDEFPILGKVYSVSPSVDPETRTFAVKLRTTQGADRVQDGEFITAWIAGPKETDTLIIPVGVARFENNQAFVFLVDPNTNKVSRVDLTLGLRGREHYQVLEGLETGDHIVTEGRARLSEGDKVRVISSGKNKAGG